MVTMSILLVLCGSSQRASNWGFFMLPLLLAKTSYWSKRLVTGDIRLDAARVTPLQCFPRFVAPQHSCVQRGSRVIRKNCNNHIIGIFMRRNWNVMRIWIVIETSLMKRNLSTFQALTMATIMLSHNPLTHWPLGIWNEILDNDFSS